MSAPNQMNKNTNPNIDPMNPTTTTPSTVISDTSNVNTTTCTMDNNTTAPVRAGATSPYTLLDGRPIDCKNTLQSFDVAATAVPAGVPAVSTTELVTTPPVTAALTLVDGRIIDCKNTLQSFAAISDSDIVAAAVAADAAVASLSSSTNTTTGTKRVIEETMGAVVLTSSNTATTTTAHLHGVIHTSNRNVANGGHYTVNDDIGAAVMTTNTNNNPTSTYYGNNHGNEPVFHTQAIPVQSLAVAEGELFDSVIQQKSTPPQPLAPPVDPNPHWKRGITFWLLIVCAILLFSLAAGIGVYCGTGNCGSSQSSSSSSSNEQSTVSNGGPVTMRAVYPTTNPVVSSVAAPQSPPITTINERTHIPTAVPNRTTARPVISTMNYTAIPTRAPIIEIPTNNPTTTSAVVVTDAPALIMSPTTMNQQLTVACTFLNITNLSQCQATTEFDTATGTVGNTIPTEIGLLTQLTHLRLYGEGLVGTIPSTLGNLIQLTYLSLWDNQLTGTIPSTLGNLVQLATLSLMDNQLNGTIPPVLGNLVHLTYVSLWNNRLTGTIPSTLGDLMNITNLYLDSNQLTGTVPSTLGNLVNVATLYLDTNQLTGTIPSTFGNLVRLTSLDLYNNSQLRGTIPLSLCSLSSEIVIVIDCENILCSCCTSAQAVNCTQ